MQEYVAGRTEEAPTNRHRSRFRACLLTACLLLAACRPASEPQDDPEAGPPAPTATVPGGAPVPTIAWDDLPGAAGLGDGWQARRCEGDAPLLCIRRGGTDMGSVELAGFPVDSFTLPGFREANARGDDLAALRAAVEDYYATFRQDRAATCGTAYLVRTLPPEEAVVAGGPGLRYGFEGVSGGTVVERHLSWSALRSGRLWVQTAAAVAEGACISREGAEWQPERLSEFAPVLARVVAATRLPAGE
jgi:hypothetical protein